MQQEQTKKIKNNHKVFWDGDCFEF